MLFLENYGWNNFHQQNFDIHKIEGQSVGRLISVKGFKYCLITENGELETELSGKLLFGSDPENLPKIGDWVCYLDYGQTGFIITVLPRINLLSRKNPGNRTEKQFLGVNIDYALIVQGLDRDFNLMRLERYLTQVTACEIKALVILNKADLVNNLDAYREEVLRLKRDCEIFFCSTLTGFGIQELKDAFERSKTYILLGSSGVGKSSLLNIFMDVSVQRISPTSISNNKGTHTTTTRDLFQLPSGSLLIDTPGMREFGLTSEDGENSGSLFPAIEEFAHRCRYKDCKHLGEAGCSVIDALQNGTLDAAIYESYIKLIKEQKRFEIKIEDKKRLGKQFGKLTREAKNYRKRYKY
jgi:ribosome biogenesis GTPase